MDTLTLKDCRFTAYIGVFPKERKTKQPIILDIELGVDARKAARSDSMDDAVDYRSVHALVKKHIATTKYFLIETLAERLAAAILAEFPVSSVTLTVRKPKPMQKRNGAWVGITVTRSR